MFHHCARPGARKLGPLVLFMALVPGCAGSRPPEGSAGSTGAPPAASATAAAPAATSVRDTAGMVLEVRLRRSAELANNNGAVRVFDQDLNIQYRVHGQGPGMDAGEVTCNGNPVTRSVKGKGAVSYRMGRDLSEGSDQAGNDPWATIANSGAVVPAASARVKLAPYPVVTQPAPFQTVNRTQELSVVTLPPVPDLWIRVSLTGAGESVIADDLGEGRYLFPLGKLAALAEGRAKILIEVEATCASCPGPPALRLNWSSHTELEIPVTLL